jgi:hypothetical protein
MKEWKTYFEDLLSKKRGITEPSEKVLWISKSIQMCPKSQKKDKKFDRTFKRF